MANRGTRAGFHYLNGYQNCPRMWMLEHGFHLEPEFKPPALTFGGAIHAAREAYYLGGRIPDLLVSAFRDSMEADKGLYADPTRWADDLSRGGLMLTTWLKAWHEADLNRYLVKEVEVEHEVPLGATGACLTIRPDLVMYDNTTGDTYAWDCKTTSWSVGQAHHQVDMLDQATAYIWGLRRIHPNWRVEGLIVDVLYNKGKVFKAERPGVIYRTEADLEAWEIEAAGVLTDLSQRMEAATTGGFPIRALFPRNGSYCARYGCSFETICRSRVDPGDVPMGFKIKADADVKAAPLDEKCQNDVGSPSEAAK